MRDGFLALTTGSTERLVSLDAFKDHLRLSTTDQDDHLETILDAVEDYLGGIDGILNRSLYLQTYTAYLRDFADCVILPLAPAKSLSAFVYLDGNGDSQEVSSSLYVENLVAKPARIERADGASWPEVAERWDAVQVTFTAGSSGTTEQRDVQHLIKLLAAHFYEQREPVVVGSIAQKIPATFDMLIDKCKVRLPM